MSYQKVGLKVPFSSEVDNEAALKSMVEWIRDDRLSGTLIDVADYSHMHNGPGVVLVAHEFMVSVDEQDGYVGLRVSHRLPSDKKLNVRVLECVQTLRQAAENFKEDLSLSFDGSKVEIFALDRLNNGDDSAELLKGALEEATGLNSAKLEGDREGRRLPGISLSLNESIL